MCERSALEAWVGVLGLGGLGAFWFVCSLVGSYSVCALGLL